VYVAEASSVTTTPPTRNAVTLRPKMEIDRVIVRLCVARLAAASYVA